jgi:hypothetical protein
MNLRFAASFSLLLAACGGSTEASPGAGGSPEAGAADAATPDAGVSPEAAADVTTASDSGGDAPSSADAATACGPGASVPSRQTVEVVVTNQAAADRYLVTAGTFCDPFSVSFSQQNALPLTLGFQCVCECPNPGPARPATLHRLAPGESFTLRWNATALTTCTETVDCAAMGWKGLGTASQLVGASAPVGPGPYGVSVGALAAVPQGCFGDGTTFNCPMSWGGGNPGGPNGIPPAIQTVCPADAFASVSFELPASGDVSVPVALTN